MSDLIKAITTNDLVKFKRVFNESMEAKQAEALEETKLRIAAAVMIEGEEPGEDDDEDDDSEDGEDKKGKPAKKDED